MKQPKLSWPFKYQEQHGHLPIFSTVKWTALQKLPAASSSHMSVVKIPQRGGILNKSFMGALEVQTPSWITWLPTVSILHYRGFTSWRKDLISDSICLWYYGSVCNLFYIYMSHSRDVIMLMYLHNNNFFASYHFSICTWRWIMFHNADM